MKKELFCAAACLSCFCTPHAHAQYTARTPEQMQEAQKESERPTRPQETPYNENIPDPESPFDPSNYQRDRNQRPFGDRGEHERFQEPHERDVPGGGEAGDRGPQGDHYPPR